MVVRGLPARKIVVALILLGCPILPLFVQERLSLKPVLLAEEHARLLARNVAEVAATRL